MWWRQEYCQPNFHGSKFPRKFGCLYRKGVPRCPTKAWAIIPKKIPHDKIFPLEDESWNATIDCIIFKNYFGHLTKLCCVLSFIYRWTEEGYDDIFCLCVALTNFHISFHLLWNDQDVPMLQNLELHYWWQNWKKHKMCQILQLL